MFALFFVIIAVLFVAFAVVSALLFIAVVLAAVAALGALWICCAFVAAVLHLFHNQQPSDVYVPDYRARSH
jgi:hypothetical protein